MAEPVPGRVLRASPARPGRANSRGPAPSVRLRRGATLLVWSMFQRLTSFENLLLAFRNASRGKRGRAEVAAFEHRLEDELLGLQSRLRDGSYRPGPYRSFAVHEPKRRLISAAPFRDRVVHHALCNVTEPLFERRFIADTFANRVGRGTHAAINRAQQLARANRYVLQCDIAQFFPSIDHAVLLESLARVMVDTETLRLAERIVGGGTGVLDGEYRMVWFAGDDLFAALRPRGLPIGNLTSQLWANWYLGAMDHYAKRVLRPRGYVRYVDDFLLFDDDRHRLMDMRDALVERLAALRLTIHPGAQARPVTEGFPFLGFTVFPQRRRLKRRKGVHGARRLRQSVAAVRAGELEPETLTARVRGWVNHVRHANTTGLRKAVLRTLVDHRDP